MAVLANPRLIGELEKYGAEHVVKCYHCGNCSATCPFSREPFLFPRKSMRYLQMGLEEKLKGTLEPWLCYYCGECSEQCPREEEPGETMMSMRRAHQPVRFHGISGSSTSPGWPVLAVLLVAALTGLGFWRYGTQRRYPRLRRTGRLPPPSSTLRLGHGRPAGVPLGINCAHVVVHPGSRRRGSVPPAPTCATCCCCPSISSRREPRVQRGLALHLALMLSYLTLLALIMFFLGPCRAACHHWGAHLRLPGHVGPGRHHDPRTARQAVENETLQVLARTD